MRRGISDNEMWVDMTNAQRLAYVLRLEEAVGEMAKELGTLRKERAEAADLLVAKHQECEQASRLYEAAMNWFSDDDWRKFEESEAFIAAERGQ